MQHTSAAPQAQQGDASAPLHRAAAAAAAAAPKQAYTDMRRLNGKSLDAVNEDLDGVSSEEEEAEAVAMPRAPEAAGAGGGRGVKARDAASGALLVKGKGGVVMDEAWQLPSSQTGGKRGVTYDQFRPPGVDSPQKTPPDSPQAVSASGSLFANTTSPGPPPPQQQQQQQRSRNMADMMPPSLSRDDDIGGPSSALLGVGVRPSELAQRSGASRGAGSRAPDGAWAGTLGRADGPSAPADHLERADRSPLPAPIGSPRSLAAAARDHDASHDGSPPPPSLLVSPREVMERERVQRQEAERLERERKEREREEREREQREAREREEREREERERREREREREEQERREREREREEQERRARQREREEREAREREQARQEREREQARQERERQERERAEQERLAEAATILAQPTSPALPESEDVEDLTARLEALQQEVAASASRVKKLNQEPAAEARQAAALPGAPRDLGGTRNFTGGLRVAPAAQIEAREEESSDGDEEEEEEEDEEDDSEWARGSARGTGGTHAPPAGGRAASPPPIDPMEIVAKRKALEEAAAEGGGAAIGAGSLFRRPTAAEMLRGAPLPSNPNLLHEAPPAPKAAGGGAKPSGSSFLAKAARSLSPGAPLVRSKSPAPPAALSPQAPPPARAAAAAASSAAASATPVPKGAVVHEGVLRRKKEDHGRFEDPYKTVCVCRLQSGVLRVRLSQNGEVVGEEERFDLREWRLLPRSDKPDRFSLTRGMSESDDERNVISFKAENKAEGNKWTDHIKASTVALRNELKSPSATAAAG